MSDMNRSFAGSMPEFYDRFLVPVRFEPFASDMAKRLDTLTAGDLLEVAAGTGILTRALARTLSPSVRITATDLNPAMIARARTHAGLERVTWREADALALPFDDRTFDCVVCQFGVMFFPDKRTAFREILRVLRPGGWFLFSVWGDRRGSVLQIATTVVGHYLSRAPASLVSPDYSDIPAVEADLIATCFRSVTAEHVAKRGLSASAYDAAVASCHGGLLRAQIDQHAPNRLDEITAAAAVAITETFGPGEISDPLHAALFSARRSF
jgi:ubiquinone/menaquinone biosynthesis C-methylase UbiE